MRSTILGVTGILGTTVVGVMGPWALAPGVAALTLVLVAGACGEGKR